jgi:hypothetical protein
MQPLEAPRPRAPARFGTELQIIPLKSFAQEQKWALASADSVPDVIHRKIRNSEARQVPRQGRTSSK